MRVGRVAIVVGGEDPAGGVDRLGSLGVEGPEHDVVEVDAPVAHHAAGVVEEPAEEEVESIGVERPLGRGAEPALVVDVGRGLAVGILAHADGADVLEVPGLHPEDLAELSRADDLDGLLEVGRRALLGADGHDLVGLAGGAEHRLAFGDVVRDRLLDVDVLAGQHGLDRGQGVPVVGRGDDHRVQVLAVEHRPIVAGRVRGVAFVFLDAFGGFAGVVVIDVGDGDDLDVGLGEERIEELIAPTPRADQAEPDFLVGRAGRGDRRSAERASLRRPRFPPPPRNRAA